VGVGIRSRSWGELAGGDVDRCTLDPGPADAIPKPLSAIAPPAV